MRELFLYFCAVVIHELGHLLGAAWMGVPVRSFGGGKWGLQLQFSMENISYYRELVVLLSGSAVGLASVLLFRDPLYTRSAWVLNSLNLLPIEGLDGGGILACLLHLTLSPTWADRLTSILSRSTAILFWSAGLWIALRADGSVVWLLMGMGMVIGQH